MKTKEQKQKDLETLTKELPESSITIFTTFAREGEPGLSVSQMQELKRALREAEADYLVAKKRLVEKALGGLKYEGIDVFSMDGSVGLVLGHGDAYATAKALHRFAKDNPSLKFFTAWMGDHALTHEELMEMATMPDKEELIARLLGMINYPLKSLAIVLNQIAEQKPADASAGSASAATEEEDGSAEEPDEKEAEKKDDEQPAEEKSEEAVETPNEENNG